MRAKATGLIAITEVKYITVKTKDWQGGNVRTVHYFPDRLGGTEANYFDPTPINVSCWTQTDMGDFQGIVNGDPLWLGIDAPANSEQKFYYISRDDVQKKNIDFQARLRRCDPPHTHAAGFIDSKYRDVNGFFSCYKTPSTSSQSIIIQENTYTGIYCYRRGGESVNGNTTWTRYEASNGDVVNKKCFVPGAWYKPSEFHGTAGFCNDACEPPPGATMCS
jgi:hypothetical protein